MYIYIYMYVYVHTYIQIYIQYICALQRCARRGPHCPSISKAPKGNGIGATGSKNPGAY